MVFKIGPTLILLGVCLAQIQIAQGDFADPFLSAIDPPPDGVTIIRPGTGGNSGQINVDENIPNEGVPLLHLAQVNVNGPGDLTILSVTPTTDAFEVELITATSTWVLKLVSSLDYEVETQRSYFLRLSHSGATVNLVLDVVDVNDNPVQIINDPSSLLSDHYDELTAPPSGNITWVEGDDKDDIDRGRLTYFLNHTIGGNGNASDPIFQIDTTSGKVFLLKELDYRVASMHRLTLTVFDSDEIHSYSVPITVDVQDLPNEAPEFVRLPPSITVNENTDVGSVVETIQARDRDLGLNWNIAYFLEEAHTNPETPRLLDIDIDTGEITVVHAIDAESILFLEKRLIFDVSITAREIPPEGFEGQELEITQTISITIYDENDRLPEICTVQEPSFDPSVIDQCSNTQSYVIQIEETHTGEVPLGGLFVVRDLDSTFSFSQYDIDFAGGTDARIRNALKIQPGSGSNITEYSIVVNNVQELDYETGAFWYDNQGGSIVPRPHIFEIIITGKQNPDHKATATFTLTVTDVNDNLPEFQDLINNQYEFHVCEQTPVGTLLNILTPPVDPTFMVCRAWTEVPGTPIKVIATDADISPEFSTITYKWADTNSRTPPVELNPVDGTMVIKIEGNAQNFDYELFPVEYFMVEAIDGGSPDESQVSRATVKFSVLDENESGSLDLRLPQSQASVQEEIDNPDFPVMTGIVITSKDLNPDIEVYLKWDDTKMFKSHASGEDEQVFFQEDPIIERWFRFLVVDATNPRSVQATLFLNDDPIDRELTDAGVDRVDLVLAARDRNEVSGNDSEVTQTLIVRITDINDNTPEWEDIQGAIVSRQVQETADFPPEGDQTSESQREIYTFRVRDRDLNSNFDFDIEALECLAECEEYLELVTLNTTYANTGKAILSRTIGNKMDREETKYFNKPTDILKYKVTVCDDASCSNKAEVEMHITIEDINDNTPQWVETHAGLEVWELDEPGTEIATYRATDIDREDKYGKVSYVLAPDTPDNVKFAIDETSGMLSVVGPFEWSEKAQYTLTIQAIDNYRPGISTDSTLNTTTTVITIKDENNQTPEFLTEKDPLAEPYETWPIVGQMLNETISIFDRDDPTLPNAEFDVEIIEILKDGDAMPVSDFPFNAGPLRDGTRPGEKVVPIQVMKSLIGEWAEYNVTFRSTDKGVPPRSREKTYRIQILNENLNEPVFVYPTPNLPEYDETIEVIRLESDLGRVVRWDGEPVPFCHATDADDGENARVTYSAVEYPDDLDDGFQYFRILFTGEIQLRELLNQTKSRHHLYIKAQDQGTISQASETRMTFLLRPDTNRPPVFDNPSINITLPENIVGADESLIRAIDPDAPFPGVPDDIVYYHLVGGDREYFRLETDAQLMPHLYTVQSLDREFIKDHQVVVFTSNSPEPPTSVTDPGQIPENDRTFLLVNIEVENEFDTHPLFPPASEGGIISGGFSMSNFPPNVIALISVIDLDDEDYITFKLSEVFTPSDSSLEQVGYPPFVLGPNELDANKSTNLLLNFPPQPNMRGHFTFNITATDRGLLSSTVQCKMYMIKDTNVVEFRFLNRVEEIEAKKARLADALSDAFQYRCNIDRVIANGVGIDANSSLCLTHFIDLATNEPISGNYIEEQQYEPEVYKRLGDRLAEVGITLAKDGIGNVQEKEDDGNDLIVYILIGGVGFMGVVLIVLGTTCYFNNRSLSRRVRALTATTFGSQMSGLNRTGAVLDLPNTNEFAIEGSNPMWTTNPGDNERRVPAFDAESVGSGGSVLIGVEDDDDFKNYKMSNVTPTAPGLDGDEDYEDDLYADPSETNHRNDIDSGSMSRSEEDGSSDGGNDGYSDQGHGHEPTMEIPPGFGNTSMRRNPLMDMAYEED